MESNWRWNVFATGNLGPYIRTSGTQVIGPFNMTFVGQLIVPIPFLGGALTHIMQFTHRSGQRFYSYGRLLAGGYVQAAMDWLPWPVSLHLEGFCLPD